MVQAGLCRHSPEAFMRWLLDVSSIPRIRTATNMKKEAVPNEGSANTMSDTTVVYRDTATEHAGMLVGRLCRLASTTN